jgi:hypothetical protein
VYLATIRCRKNNNLTKMIAASNTICREVRSKGCCVDQIWKAPVRLVEVMRGKSLMVQQTMNPKISKCPYLAAYRI